MYVYAAQRAAAQVGRRDGLILLGVRVNLNLTKHLGHGERDRLICPQG